MFQVFHMDVAKVDRDVAYVVSICRGMLQAFCSNVSSVFSTYVASVFIWMLHMFHTYVASVLSGFCVCFTMVSSVFEVFL
jgi:hypothetical protein